MKVNINNRNRKVDSKTEGLLGFKATTYRNQIIQFTSEKIVNKCVYDDDYILGNKTSNYSTIDENTRGKISVHEEMEYWEIASSVLIKDLESAIGPNNLGLLLQRVYAKESIIYDEPDN